MSFLGGADRSADGDLDGGRRPVVAHYEQRRATRTDRLCAGTLACEGCDAPIAPGAEPISLTRVLTCPWCARSAPAREFLSLSAPTRPARVVVRISR